MRTIFSSSKLRKQLDETSFFAVRKVSKRLNYFLQKGRILFDYNGHHRTRLAQPICPKEYEYAFRRDFGYEETLINRLDHHVNYRLKSLHAIQSLQNVLDNPGPTWIQFGLLDQFTHCNECGQLLKYKFNGEVIKAINKCKHPTGSPPIKFNIDIPSGFMVFSNYFDNVEKFDADEAYHLGLFGYCKHKAELEHYAKQSVAQVFCGNSCPKVNLDKENNILYVGRDGFDENDNEVIDHLPGQQVASICTDLWAWSMCDSYKAKELGIFNPDEFVAVTPGNYTVTQYFYSNNGRGDDRKADIFATIQLNL